MVVSSSIFSIAWIHHLFDSDSAGKADSTALMELNETSQRHLVFRCVPNSRIMGRFARFATKATHGLQVNKSRHSEAIESTKNCYTSGSSHLEPRAEKVSLVSNYCTGVCPGRVVSCVSEEVQVAANAGACGSAKVDGLNPYRHAQFPAAA